LAAEVLLAHALGVSRIALYAGFEQEPSPEKLGLFRGLVKRAAAHEPIAYLVGEKEFFSLPFFVSQSVLIPRPETETLVEVAIDSCKDRSLSDPRLLDLGTGSGCIAVSFLKQMPDASAVAADLSAEALEVAGRNAERHSVADRCVLVEADKLDLPASVTDAGGFDLILSNPPYVPHAAFEELDANVRDFEPGMALTDKDDGLSFYRSFAAGAPDHLNPGGILIVEVGADQASDVVEVVTGGGRLVHRTTIKDRVVGHERVVVFELSA
jgi:release factor glutamine methyltransferase